MWRKYSSTETFSADAGVLCDHLMSAFEDADIFVVDRDDQAHTVDGSASAGMRSWGEKIVAKVTETETGSLVSIESKLKFGLLDWGKNQKNVEAIFEALKSQVN